MGKNKGEPKALQKLEENIEKLKEGVNNQTIKIKKKKNKGPKDSDAADKYSAKAAELLREKERKFKERVENPKPNDKDMKWYKNLSEKGTLKDKIMSLTLIVKKDTISSLDYVRTLLKLANKKDRKQAFMAIDSLQEIFTKHLLPEDRKLKTFKMSIAEAEESKKQLTDSVL